MPDLNETLSFDVIATRIVRRAFTGECPESKEHLAAGSKLYKWTQHPLTGPRGITAWWSLVNPLLLKTGIQVPGLRETQTWAARTGRHDRDYARVLSAVTKQWNRMDRPLFAELLQPVWAWVGKASGQLEDENEPKVFSDWRQLSDLGPQSHGSTYKADCRSSLYKGRQGLILIETNCASLMAAGAPETVTAWRGSGIAKGARAVKTNLILIMLSCSHAS